MTTTETEKSDRFIREAMEHFQYIDQLLVCLRGHPKGSPMHSLAVSDYKRETERWIRLTRPWYTNNSKT